MCTYVLFLYYIALYMYICYIDINLASLRKRFFNTCYDVSDSFFIHIHKLIHLFCSIWKNLCSMWKALHGLPKWNICPQRRVYSPLGKSMEEEKYDHISLRCIFLNKEEVGIKSLSLLFCLNLFQLLDTLKLDIHVVREIWGQKDAKLQR